MQESQPFHNLFSWQQSIVCKFSSLLIFSYNASLGLKIWLPGKEENYSEGNEQLRTSDSADPGDVGGVMYGSRSYRKA